jgi:hypothetical protein
LHRLRSVLNRKLLKNTSSFALITIQTRLRYLEKRAPVGTLFYNTLLFFSIAEKKEAKKKI